MIDANKTHTHHFISISITIFHMRVCDSCIDLIRCNLHTRETNDIFNCIFFLYNSSLDDKHTTNRS